MSSDSTLEFCKHYFFYDEAVSPVLTFKSFILATVPIWGTYKTNQFPYITRFRLENTKNTLFDSRTDIFVDGIVYLVATSLLLSSSGTVGYIQAMSKYGTITKGTFSYLRDNIYPNYTQPWD